MERIDQLEALLAATPGDSFLCHALALEHIKKGDDNAARVLFEQLLQREPGYVGSYYHLGKLLERASDYAFAILTYKAGMEAAKSAGDKHSYGELLGALEEITD